MPKANMYQSLHTTLIGPNGQPFEIQIRTYEMHKTAEYGIAAHWKYKESSDGKKPVDQQEAEKMTWLRQILEWQRDMSDNREFMNLLKSDLDLFSESVYCFTPSGDVKTLPSGSTPIDFAYSVHSAARLKPTLNHRCSMPMDALSFSMINLPASANRASLSGPSFWVPAAPSLSAV